MSPYYDPHNTPVEGEGDERKRLGDLGASWVRTVVPGLWGTLVGALLTWLSSLLPVDLVEALGDALNTEAAVGAVTLAGLALWYTVWRKVEAHIPAWLVRIVLGSAQKPHYTPPA